LKPSPFLCFIWSSCLATIVQSSLLHFCSQTEYCFFFLPDVASFCNGLFLFCVTASFTFQRAATPRLPIFSKGTFLICPPRSSDLGIVFSGDLGRSGLYWDSCCKLPSPCTSLKMPFHHFLKRPLKRGLPHLILHAASPPDGP